MKNEPLAIVGIGCRFPGGVTTPSELVAMLSAKGSGIVDVPEDRWDAEAFYHPDFTKPGRIHVRRGGFLRDIDQFDAAFFGLSPNEARRMDPQQRLILETAFEAIQDSGTPLERLAGKNVAVVVGAGLRDYDGVLGAPCERSNIGATTNTGSALSIIANRVSYLFDLRGPSFAVDTACSSSLTALHCAARAIWNDGIEAALVGGVNLMIKPEVTMGFSKGGYLSPDALCRAFSDDANGYVRSEGAAVIMLKPLSAALRDRDHVYALVRGTWINQDGTTPGMTVPSREAQEALLRAALDNAGVAPSQIAYVEAHGTGTKAGDPIEATAIGNVVGKSSGRSDVCFIGSVKTNLGHMECAAGMAGLVKLALSLHDRTIYPNVNFTSPNKGIDFDGLALGVATAPIALPAEGTLFGGVNSFGFGGANGHAVLETPPRAATPAVADVPGPHPLFLSARTAAALEAHAGALATHIETSDLPLAAFAATLSERRSRFEFRAAIAPASREEAVALLRKVAAREADDAIVVGRASERQREKVAFVFTGQGAQWWGMARTLLAANEVFKATIAEVGAELRSFGWLADEGGSLEAELTKPESSSRIHETRIAQPCLYAVQVGLSRVLASHGVVPDAATGHSIGELAAAVATGTLTVREGARIVFHRSRCQARAEGSGAMAALGLPEKEVAAWIAPLGGKVEIAAVNGPAAVTVAGTHEGIASVLEEAARRGVFHRKLDVSVPFHCFLMDPIREAFQEGLGTVDARPSSGATFFSTVTGDAMEGNALDTAYWYANIREPVRYQSSFEALVRAGYRTFVEVGPHPALMHGSKDTLAQKDVRAHYVPTLLRKADDPTSIARTLGRLFVAGAACRATTDAVAPALPLPHYPFERRRFWLETESGRRLRRRPETDAHPHLTAMDPSATVRGATAARVRLDTKAENYLLDHKVQGHVVFPGAGQLDLFTAAGRLALAAGDPDASIAIHDVEFRRPVVIDDADGQEFKVEIYSEEGDLVLASRGDTTEPWTEHARARVRRTTPTEAPLVDLDALRARITEELPAAELYRACGHAGLELGPTFRGIVKYFRDDARGEYLTRIEPPKGTTQDLGRFVIHPALLDAVLQTSLAIGKRGRSEKLFLPYRVGKLTWTGAVPRGAFWAHATTVDRTDEEVTLTVSAIGPDGREFVRIEGFVVKHVQGSATRTDEAPRVTPRFEPLPREGGEARSLAGETWLVVVPRHDATRRVVPTTVTAKLRALGAKVIHVQCGVTGGGATRRDDGVWEVDLGSKTACASLAREAGAVRGIVHAGVVVTDALSPLESVRAGALGTGHLVAALAGHRTAGQKLEVWLVTHGAQRIDEEVPHASAAPLLGFGRVLASEDPSVATVLVDVADSPLDADGDLVATEIALGPDELEIAFRGGGRLVRRYTRVADSARAVRTFDGAKEGVRAFVRTPGVLGSIALEHVARPAPGPSEVEIEVRAVGLIFRDIVVGMGMLPKEAWKNGLAGADIGSDLAGVVVRKGDLVDHVGVGDRVIAIAPRALGTYAIARARHVAPLPDGIGFADAAALPTCCVTVEFALNKIARLGRGETVLVHSAAGGIGLVAVQLAKSLGARVIGTTSSPDKIAVLRELGVDHIVESRRDFTDGVLAATGGEGVDVVLGSFVGEQFGAALRLLKPFGRFVDIGKVDIYRNRQVGLLQFAENRSYTVLDINRWSLNPSVDMADMMTDALSARLSGWLKTYPVKTFPFEKASEALVEFSQGRNIGKIVVEVPAQASFSAYESRTLALDPSAVYLVTGGCGGFGLAVAGMLVDRGARHLLLLGRSGVKTDDDAARITALRDKGARVDTVRCDVSKRDDLARVLSEATATARLGGVVHAAMVLDDAPIPELDLARYAKVVEPKAVGAQNLHELTKDLPLDFFVLLSSIAAVIGTPGQASYAAANAYLDQLAEHRRALGLVGTSVNFGVLGEVGVVARESEERKRRILSQGASAMTTATALEFLEKTILGEHAVCTAAEVDWRRVSERLARRGRPDRFAELAGARTETAEGARLATTLPLLPHHERAPAIVQRLAPLLAKLAGLGDAAVDPDASLGRHGLDSLAVAQVQSWVADELGVTLPLVRLMRGPSLNELAAELAIAVDAPTRATPLLVPLSDRPTHARGTVVLFPPMGSDATFFRGWAEEARDVDLRVVEMPAPAEASGAPDPAQLEEAVLDELAALAEKNDGPFLLYGHSMGAYLALRAARRLQDRDVTATALILGAVPLPGEVARMLPDGVDAFDDLSLDHARAALETMEAGSPRAALSPELRDKALGLVRRDLWLTLKGGFDPNAMPTAPDAIPTVLVGGDGDAVDTFDKHPARSRELGVVEVLTVRGSHAFAFEAEGRRDLWAILDARLSATEETAR